MTLMIPAVFDSFMSARRMSIFISCTKNGINKLQVKLYDFMSEWGLVYTWYSDAFLSIQSQVENPKLHKIIFQY